MHYMRKAWQKFFDPKTLIPALLVLVLNLLLMAGAFYVLAASKRDIEEKTRLMANNLAHLIQQDVENELEKIDIALQDVVDDYRYYQRLGEPEFEAWMQRIKARHQALNVFRITDAAGEVRYAREDRQRLKTNLADRPYFQHLQNNDAANLQISDPVFGRTTGAMVIVLAKRLNSSTGEFNGIVFASIQLEHFRRQFAALQLGSQDSVTLRNAQHKIIVRIPFTPQIGEAGSMAMSTPFRNALQAQAEQGFYDSGATSIDGIDRTYAYQRNQKYGYYVNVGLAKSQYLAAWRAEVHAAKLALSLCAGLSLVLLWVSLRTLRRQHSARLQLVRSATQFHAFFDHAMIGMAMTSLSKGWLLVNPALGQILGYSVAQLQSKTWAELTHPDDLPADIAQFNRVLGGEIDGYSMEKRFIRQDGGIVHAFITARVVRRPDGEIDFFAASIEDISERKQAEQRLRDSLALFRRFVDHFPGIVFIKDAQQRYLMRNQFAAKAGDASVYIGKTSTEVYPDGFGAKVDADDQRILASGQSEIIEERHGEQVLEAHKFVIEDEQGHRNLCGLVIDITDKYRANERFKALLTINEIGGLLAEKEFLTQGLELAESVTESRIGFLHFVNEDQETIELVAWTRNALQGCTASYDNHYPISQAGIWADCFRAHKALIINDYAQMSGKRGLPDGHTRLERLISVPVLEEGKVRLILGVGNKSGVYDDFDIGTIQLIGNDLWRIVRRMRVEQALEQQLDATKQLLKKLEQTQQQLLQSEKMAAIGQLAAGLAHEINNPIGFIQSNLGTLVSYVDDLLIILHECEACTEHSPDSVRYTAYKQLRTEKQLDFIHEDIRQLLSESRDGAERVRRIVQNLKDFSHVSENEWGWADLHQGLDSTLNMVWHEVKYRAELEKQYGELPQVYCMPAQLNQVFLNLLVNAAQAIREHGKIVIATGQLPDAQVWIEIRDNGQGIAPENMPHIFEPFFTTKPVGQGTGLGLSLSHGIIDRHHGTLSVSSEPGRGSTFRIVLPIEYKAE